MIQRRSGVGLLLEACPAGQIGQDLFRENLQRNVATKTRVARPIHFSHSASAKRADDFIGTQANASRRGIDGNFLQVYWTSCISRLVKGLIHRASVRLSLVTLRIPQSRRPDLLLLGPPPARSEVIRRQIHLEP